MFITGTNQVHSITDNIFTTMFITGTNQVSLITDNILALKSVSVFYERAKLTGPQYKHRVVKGAGQ